MRLNSKQICEYTGGSYLVEPIDASKLALGISWDSRDVKEDDVYVALPGERVDGHNFIGDALRKGATIVLVMDNPNPDTCLFAREMGAAIIEVSNTSAAITDLARAWRRSLRGHVIGITGSSGKTTTKNLVRDVLSESFTVVATEANQNNELGVPKTLLRADPETQAIVVEMGMRGLGQIEELCDFIKPDMGLVTNVSDGHIELLGSRENIARAKGELISALPNGSGKAFLERDGEYSGFIRELAEVEKRGVSTIYFGGVGSPSDFPEQESQVSYGAWADDIVPDEQGNPSFMLHIGDKVKRCVLPLSGFHNVANATAAASIGFELGMDIETIVAALGQAKPESGRQEIVKARGDFTIINDAYNANPDSMRASLIMFSEFDVPGRRIAVLGDMGELGDYAPACHKGVGELVSSLNIDLLVCIGDLSRYTAKAAEESGMPKEKICYVSSIADILGELDTYVLPGDAVLVKASHFMGLERVVGGLIN